MPGWLQVEGLLAGPEAEEEEGVAGEAEAGGLLLLLRKEPCGSRGGRPTGAPPFHLSVMSSFLLPQHLKYSMTSSMSASSRLQRGP